MKLPTDDGAVATTDASPVESDVAVPSTVPDTENVTVTPAQNPPAVSVIDPPGDGVGLLATIDGGAAVVVVAPAAVVVVTAVVAVVVVSPAAVVVVVAKAVVVVVVVVVVVPPLNWHGMWLITKFPYPLMSVGSGNVRYADRGKTCRPDDRWC